MRHARLRDSRRDGTVVAVGIFLILVVGIFFGVKALRSPKNDSGSSAHSSSPKVSSSVPTLSTSMVFRRSQEQESEIEFIDIRSREAFDREHIPRSRHLDLSQLTGYSPPTGKTAILVTSALTGETTETANEILKSKSFAYAFLEGGFETWASEGRPVISQGDPNSFVDQSKVSYISVAETKTALEKNDGRTVILDIRKTADYTLSHAEKSLSLPLSDIEWRLGSLPLGKVFVTCGESALTSFQGAVRLADLNQYSVRALDGTCDQLAKAGIPFISTEKK